MSKKKTKKYLKNTKETIAFNGYSAEGESYRNSKPSWYLEHRIEQRENAITFRTYIEKTYDTTSPKDIKELEEILEKQKSPLPKVLTDLEKEQWKFAKDSNPYNPKPHIYSYTDMFQIKEP